MRQSYLLDRDTGAAIFPVEERPVPASDTPGERASATQPFPIRPAPITPERLTAADVWGATPEEREQCRAAIASARADGIFTPPSTRGTVIFPGNIGGSNWSGAAWGSAHGRLVRPNNRL